MTTPQTIIFDLDGTLIHSVPDMHVSLNRTLKALERDEIDLATATSFVGNGVERLIERALTATGGLEGTDLPGTVQMFLEDYETQKTVLTRPYAGVVSCLERLRSQGIILGVCTNKPQEPAYQMCVALGLESFFSDITGARPEVARKPDPASLNACMTRLNALPGSTLYVGDSVVDYETARAAPLPFRLFTGGYLNGASPDLRPNELFDDWAKVQFSL